MTQPDRSYILEGELVRDEWDYEYDELEVNEVGLREFVDQHLGPGRTEPNGRSMRKTYYGRVRLTLEVLE